MKNTISAVAALALAGEVSAFWRLPCRSQTGLGRIDPIVSPGQIADHAHILFGSGAMSMTATGEELAASDCTSCQVSQDKSAYWTPPIYFQYTNGTTVMVPNVGGMLAYYLLYLDNLEPFPEGFQVLAGNPTVRNFTGPFPDTQLSFWPTDASEDQFFLQQRAIGFNCLNYAKTPEPSLYRHQFPSKAYMDANCVDGLRMEMAFPSCGNGSATASDHQSHMRYPSLVKEGNCPEGFDHHYPFLFFETIWDTYAFAGEDGQFVISTGDPVGTSYHGDFMMGWESTDFLQNAINTCTSPTGEIQDCPLFDIQSTEVGAQCTFAQPELIKNDDNQGPRSGLPVDVPVQYGPQQATKYPIAGQVGVPTSALPHTATPSSVSSRPDLSYTAANPSLTSTAQGGIVVAAAGSGFVENQHAHSSASASVPAPAVTTSASPLVSSANSAWTSYMTQGNSIIEMVMEQVEVTVTAAATATDDAAAAKHKRHLDHHVHHHHH